MPKSESFAGAVLRVPIEDYVENFLEIAKLAKTHGASVAVIGPVYRGFDNNLKESERMTRHRDALRTAMHEAEIPYLEIPELTEQNRANNLMLFGEPVDPTVQGHRLMEVRLIEFLASQEMLWDLSVPELNDD